MTSSINAARLLAIMLGNLAPEYTKCATSASNMSFIAFYVPVERREVAGNVCNNDGFRKCAIGAAEATYSGAMRSFPMMLRRISNQRIDFSIY